MRLADRFRRRPAFWRRQFDGHPTGAQTAFDVVFGIVLPLLCLVADPIVFRGNGKLGLSEIGRYAVPAYLLMGLQMAALAAWLAVRSRAGRSAAFFAGPFVAGAFFALALGLVMLPLSMIGLVMLIGILGFTPFATSLVFLRNGVRAWRQAGPYVGRAARTLLLAAGALGAVAPAAAARLGSERAIAEVIANPLSREAIFWASVMSANQADDVLRAYGTEPDPIRRELLGMAYREITGEDAETILARRSD